ncbi:ATP-binding protein [Maridesulfovibrio hydrothermalis]|uniref:histidine kinase n=1 Tax=Maridesulfovibrio hydrothermalis AM13 = DSM 14728 TaxID=1121451 RepID=L0RF52_9BACT|nr:ATP-binding protein [Maridesulfovibrio hydrothermalis]CCO25384.1 Signal transduction histidine kinase, nitrogen specific, NtrB [Maridesulfovibrio hydrothermalis AM13 = DSM 14728]
MVKFLKIRKGQVLPYRLLIYILICSSFFTVIGTSVQLYMEYRSDVSEIQKGMEQIEQSYVNTIAASLWDINIDHVKIQLEGALKLPGMRYLEVVEMSFGSVDPVASIGAAPDGKNVIERTYPLIHVVDGKSVEVGQLKAVAGLDNVFKRLRLRVFVVLLTQGVKTFLVALFILMIIHYMVTRHLQAMAEYAQEMDINNLDRELVLKRRGRHRKPDEIDKVAQAFNEMRLNLIRDIAERKKVEEALKESNMIVEKSPVVLFKWRNEEGWPVEVVSQNVSQIGLKAEDFLSGKLKYIDVIHPEDIEKVGKEMDYYIQSGTDHFLQKYRIIDPTGRVYWIEDSTVLVRDDNGEVTHYLGIASDATERVMAEDELGRLRNLLKNTIDSMPTVLVGVDEQIRINQWNKSAEEETHKTYDEVKGLYLLDVFPQLEGELDLIKQSVNELEVKEKNKVPFTHEGAVQYKNIKIYPLLESEDGRGAVVLIDDVTMKSRLEDMMIQTEKMMSVGGLAAGMAHEINNPLGAVLSGVQGTERRLSPSLKKNIEVASELGLDLNKVHQYMDQRGILGYLRGISDAGRRAARIVRNMLEFSRKSESSRTETDVKGILEKTLSLAENDYDLKKKYDFKTIEVRRDYEQGLPTVSITETEIEQVFLNIFKNAAQAMSDKDFGDELPNITLRTRKDGKFVRIEVEDNGPGMDEDVRKRVFEPFYTTKHVGLGTGLGLSVSYFIITRNHEGEFLVESEPGKGSKFIIRLPAVERLQESKS